MAAKLPRQLIARVWLWLALGLAVFGFVFESRAAFFVSAAVAISPEDSPWFAK